jgi:hypothetical protein
MGYAVVSLTLEGELLDPDAVTRVLGLSPTESHIPGELNAIRRYGERVGRIGHWYLSRRDLRVEDIQTAVSELVGLYLKKRASLVGIERCLVSIGLMNCRSMGDSFVLAPELIRVLAEAGCTLFVDAYGQAENDSASS